LFTSPLYAYDVHRFEANQLEFALQYNEGEKVRCTHEILPHVPWWQVRCDQRLFTVNTWMQLLKHKTLPIVKLTLMFDVSESVRPGGPPAVQFRSHLTSLTVESLTEIQEIQTSLDVL